MAPIRASSVIIAAAVQRENLMGAQRETYLIVGKLGLVKPLTE